MPKSHKKNLRILVADDHPIVRMAVRQLLEHQRFWQVVGQAANGREATRKAKNLKPDIAVVDIEMPESDGLAAIAGIREQSPYTKIIALTRHESSTMVRQALEAGARGYVSKSDLMPDLIHAVRAVSMGKLFLGSRVSDIVIKAFLDTGGIKVTPARHLQAHPSPREAEIIGLLARGKTNKVIAGELGIATRTVETHRATIMRKLGLHSLTEILHYAIGHGMFAIPTPAMSSAAGRSANVLSS